METKLQDDGPSYVRDAIEISTYKHDDNFDDEYKQNIKKIDEKLKQNIKTYWTDQGLNNSIWELRQTKSVTRLTSFDVMMGGSQVSANHCQTNPTQATFVLKPYKTQDSSTAIAPSSPRHDPSTPDYAIAPSSFYTPSSPAIHQPSSPDYAPASSSYNVSQPISPTYIPSSPENSPDNSSSSDES